MFTKERSKSGVPLGRVGAFTIVALLLLVSVQLWQTQLPCAVHTGGQKSFQMRGALRGTQQPVSGSTGTIFLGTKQRKYGGPKIMTVAQDPLHATAGSSTRSSSQSSTLSGSKVSGPGNKKWAVVTTIHPPSEAITRVLALQGWSVVVVGDTKSVPFNLTHQNLVFLDAAAQSQLAAPYAGITKLLPWRHFGRKNIGYLYAIVHGAETIFDLDDDNILKDGMDPAVPSEQVFCVEVRQPGSCPSFNPYPRMGGPSATDPRIPPSWPRGFPLDLIRSPCPHTLVPAGNASRIAVLQSLADHDPDVDAIYRLTRGVPFSFDPRSRRTLVIPKGTLTPWNAQATLVLQPALWALLLPITVHGRVSDIWRSYVTQRLLWDIGYSTAFSPPMVNQHRPPHSYLADMQAEHDLYAKSGKLVELLREWRGAALTLPGRFEELMIELYEREFVEVEDVELTQQWLLALTASGYKFPPLMEPTSDLAARSPPSSSGRNATAPTQLQPKSVTRPRPQGSGATSTHWAVFTGSGPAPTAAIKHLAGLPGWRVVVVADESARGNWSWPNVTLLLKNDPDTLGYSIAQHMAWKSVSRKNLGYLYAISQGATVVYDASESVRLLQDYTPVLACNSSDPEINNKVQDQPCQGQYTVLEANATAGTRVWNPYPIFGQPHVCPRGFPPNNLHATPQDTCFRRTVARPLIQQGLINGLPDTDPSYHGSQPLQVTFQRSAFSVVVPERTYAPINSHNTLFFKDALWGLLLPVSTSEWVADTWRGFWMQRLLPHIGANVAILPPTAQRLRGPGPGNGSRTLFKETPYSESNKLGLADALLQELDAMRLKEPTLQGQMLEVAKMMATNGYWQHQDVELMEAWIKDLNTVGYMFPPLLSPAALNSRARSADGAKASGDSAPSNNSVPGGNVTRYLEQWLGAGTLEHSFAFKQRWCQRLDTMLIVNMNRIGEDNLKRQIRLLHAVYRPLFWRVMITGSAGPTWATPEPHMQQLMDQGYVFNCANFTRRTPDVGFYTYACAVEGILQAERAVWRPDMDVQAFNMLYINDDVAFSPCMMAQFHRDNIWYPHTVATPVSISDQKDWWWDYDMTGRGVTLRQSLASAIANAWGSMAVRVDRYLKPGESFPNNQGDVYYLPARFQMDFVQFVQQFESQYVMSEIAIPNILGLLKNAPNDIDFMTFAMAWGDGRSCLEERIDRVLPLGANVNLTVVRSCGVNVYAQESHSNATSIFAIHPIKMSDTRVAGRWLHWWLSQTC